MQYDWTFWVLFHLILFFLLYIDLHYMQRKKGGITLSSAIGWSIGWIVLSLVFNFGIYLYAGKEAALSFLTGYLIEKSLSIDNIFVFLIIFSFFQIDKKEQHRILYLGILGALVLRLGFILSGVSLLHRFAWMYYVLGAFLCITALRFAVQKETAWDIKKSWILCFFTRHFRIASEENSRYFFIRQKGKIYCTRLLLALIMVESADLIFAIDSIPAILAITTEPFLVYTSNICAILGLRSLYFVVSHFHEQFQYLKWALAAVLFFVGGKMLLSSIYPISVGVSLGVIAAIFLTAALCSFLSRRST